MVFLVINENKDSEFLPVAERYRLFRDCSEAMNHAAKIGFRNPWFLGINKKPGICNLFMQGDTRVSIIPLDISDEGATPMKTLMQHTS